MNNLLQFWVKVSYFSFLFLFRLFLFYVWHSFYVNHKIAEWHVKKLLFAIKSVDFISDRTPHFIRNSRISPFRLFSFQSELHETKRLLKRKENEHFLVCTSCHFVHDMAHDFMLWTVQTLDKNMENSWRFGFFFFMSLVSCIFHCMTFFYGFTPFRNSRGFFRLVFIATGRTTSNKYMKWKKKNSNNLPQSKIWKKMYLIFVIKR